MYVMNDKHEYYKIRLTAAEALGKIGNIYAVVPLINIATDEEEKSVYVRESAVKALAMIGDERAVEPLISVIETKNGIIDKFTFLKERIIETLGKLGFKKDKRIDALKKALFDESPHIKIRAIEALCEIEDDIILTLLEPMIYDKDENVSRSAINALYLIESGEYLLGLLERHNLPQWCREEINEILTEDEEDDEEDDE
jgi:HEAT repeat protein